MVIENVVFLYPFRNLASRMPNARKSKLRMNKILLANKKLKEKDNAQIAQLVPTYWDLIFYRYAKCQTEKTKKPVLNFFREAIFCQGSHNIINESKKN